MQTFDTPILILLFNRPEFVVEQVKILRKLNAKNIFLSADGPRIRNREDEEQCNQCRTLFFKEIDWDCKIETNFFTKNQGCSLAPMNGIKWFFTYNKEGIVIEDDHLPSISFFYFCQFLLDKYRSNNKISTINGCNFGYDNILDSSYGFTKFMNPTGWASWQDRINEIDFSINRWEKTKFKKLHLYKILRTSFWDFDYNWLKYWESKLNDTIKKDNITWWDYQFMYNQLTKKQYSVFPHKNLVQNIGFNSKGTHTKDPNILQSKLLAHEISFPLNHNNNIKILKTYEEKYIKEIWAHYKRPNWKYYIGLILGKHKLKK